MSPSFPPIESPITTHMDTEVKLKVLRQLYTPQQRHPLYAGLLSTETGLQTGTNIETSKNYREPLSIINDQSNPLQFTGRSLSYHQNIPDNKPHQAAMTTQNGVRPASSFERWQSSVNDHPPSHEVSQSGNPYDSYPVFIRKSSYKEAVVPVHQSSSPQYVWGLKGAQKSYNQENNLRNVSPMGAKDETVWQPSDSSLFSSQTGRHWSTSLPTSSGHYSGYKEINELAAPGPWSTSSGIQSSKFFGFTSQTAPHAPSISVSPDAYSAIKHHPSSRKLTQSITDFSRGLDSVSNSEIPRHKKVQSYLFKDSQASSGGRDTVNTVPDEGSGAFSTTPHKLSKVYSRFSSNFQQPQRKEPTKEVQRFSDNANPLYPNANVAQYGAKTKYQRTSAETPAPGPDSTMESFVPTLHADFQGSFATGSDKSVVNSLVNTTTRGSVHAYKPLRTTKSIYGFRGFKNPTWKAVKEPSFPSTSGSNEKNISRRYSFDKGKFKIANVYPSLSAKYSFGHREASTTPAKLERTPTDYFSLSPATVDVTQTMITPRPSTMGFKEAWPLLPESDASMDKKPDRRPFRIYRRIYGLKGFGTRPLEGAKPLVSEPNMSAKIQQGFEGFKLRSWQPKSSRIHRWYNKTESSSSNVNELSSEDLQPLLKTAGSTEAATGFTSDEYKKNRKIYTLLGFQPVQKRSGNATNETQWMYKEQNPSKTSASHTISSAYLRSAGNLKVEPRPPNKTKPVEQKASLFGLSTSSMVRGKRVKGKHTNGERFNESTSLTNYTKNVAIVRLPKRPARVKAVTYADILGSASFTGVRVTTQTPITLADKDYFPNATAATEQEEGAGYWTVENAVQSRYNMSKSPEDEGEDFSSVKGVDLKTSDLFLDGEGSGSGGFNVPDVFSADTTKSQGGSDDLLELDYLRISTGNMSFKSMKLAHADK